MKDSRHYAVLLIEDNPGDCVLVEEMLYSQMHAPAISQAETFQQAKSHLTGDIQFDIVLLDLSLPDKSGEALITEVLSLTGNVPVIALTGYADISFSIRSLSLGISDYLLKDDLTASSLYKSILYNIERKKISRELVESEKRYSDLFQLSPQPMWVSDLTTWQFLDVNEAAVAHYGYSRDEFMQMTIRDLWQEDDIALFDEAIRSLKKDQFLLSGGLYRHRKKNKEIVHVDIRSNRIEYKGRHAEVVLVNDITENLRYIAAIEDQNKRLREIAWKQSHEVRGPLARIMGVINLIDKTEGSSVSRNDMLKMIIQSAHELDAVIREITAHTDEVNVSAEHPAKSKRKTRKVHPPS